MTLKPNTLSVLTSDECKSLSEAALKILEEIGVLVTHPEAVELLLEAGGKKGEDGRIHINGVLVRQLVSKGPGRFKLHDRCGGEIEIGSGRSWTMCGGTVARVTEWPRWSLRAATRADVAGFARLCDALPLVHCVVPVVEAQDVDPSRAEIVSFLETITNTTKFVLVCPVVHASAQAWVEMGRIATGSCDLSAAPSIGLLATVLPNLHLDNDCAATVILAAREGLPLVSMGGAVAGSSVPNTVASATAVKLAGELFIAVLSQIVRPGTPVMLDCGVVVMDMNTADIGEAGPEYPLGVAAVAQEARTFGLPTYSCALHCEAKVGDFQAGMEKMAGMMAAVLAGVDMTTNMGMLSRCSAASFEQLLVDHELCAFMERFGRGITVNDDTLALDVIREVGMGGTFITHDHTVRQLRSGEIWYPTLLDRTAVGVEAEDLYKRAHTRVEEILKGHEPQVDGGVRKALTSYAESLAGGNV